MVANDVPIRADQLDQGGFTEFRVGTQPRREHGRTAASDRIGLLHEKLGGVEGSLVFRLDDGPRGCNRVQGGRFDTLSKEFLRRFIRWAGPGSRQPRGVKQSLSVRLDDGHGGSNGRGNVGHRAEFLLQAFLLFHGNICLAYF